MLSLLSISYVQYTNADVQFSMKSGKTFSFRGKQLVAIVAWLNALGIPSAPQSDEWTLRPGHGILTATFASGLLQRHGVLAIGSDSLVFLPQGTIDLSLGTWPLCIPIRDILKLEESDDAITVSAAEEEWVFLNCKTSQLITPLSRALHPEETSDSLLVGPEQWAGSALLLDRGLLLPGVLSFAMANDELLFTSGTGETRNLGSLLRTRSEDDDGGEQFSDSLQSRDERWRLQFPTDSKLLAQLLSVVGNIEPKMPPEDQRIKPLKLLQKLDAIRIDHSDGNSQTYRPVSLTFEESTVDIILPRGRLDESVTSLITNFTLLGRQVYRLRSMAWRIEDVAHDELDPELELLFKDSPDIVRLRFPWPTTKQLQKHTNRRELYRISLSVGEQMVLNVENEELPVKLLNLSAGGLGISCNQEIQLGQMLVLAIGIPSADSEIKTEVVWVRKAGGRYRVGLRFLNNNESFRQLMIQKMYRLELLASKGDKTPLQTLTGKTGEE
ncbi:MAG: PilZ domain-containing protein [Myxococcota bacterium]|nr:PilZ domain-containing protein [Myxococcota bacterium]